MAFLNLPKPGWRSKKSIKLEKRIETCPGWPFQRRKSDDGRGTCYYRYRLYLVIASFSINKASVVLFVWPVVYSVLRLCCTKSHEAN